jgi:hypothetical protein
MTVPGVTLVAIQETDVFGVKAYKAACMHCPWVCHEQPHSREATAVRHADDHDCEALRRCTCGGSDYVSCLCNLTPREWLAYAKTNPRVDQGLALPKELQ